MKKIEFTRFAPSPGGATGQGAQEFLVNGKQAGIILKDPHPSTRKVLFYTVISNVLGPDKNFHVGDFPNARAAYKAARDHVRATHGG